MKQRIDPRIARSRAAILGATNLLIDERGLPGVTLDAVAARSGCAKTTIYRHWPDKGALLLDAVRARAQVTTPAPPTGDPHADLVATLAGLARAWSAHRSAITSMVDAAQRDEEIAQVHLAFAAERRDLLAPHLVALGIEPGEALEHTLDLLVGALFYRLLHRQEGIREGDIAALARRVVPDPGGDNP